jgi:cephalosporin hydroxylase
MLPPYALFGYASMNGKLLPITDFVPRSGFCFTTRLPQFGDSADVPSSAQTRLFENGSEIGPAHSLHKDIEEVGRGRYSHWGHDLYFSSSDGSSPKKNQRRYHVLLEQPAEKRTVLAKSTFLPMQSGVMRYPYKGIQCCKSPIDMALYQMLIWRERPRTILELGTLSGGSAVWFADVLTTFGIDGHVHSLDIAPVPAITSPKITFYRGDILDLMATWPADWIKSLPRPILLIDDAGHQYEMSKAALEYGARVLEKGEYLVVEDGIATPMDDDAQYNGGPLRAIDEFLSSRTEFTIDRDICDFFGKNVTWSIDGFLRRT